MRVKLSAFFTILRYYAKVAVIPNTFGLIIHYSCYDVSEYFTIYCITNALQKLGAIRWPLKNSNIINVIHDAPGVPRSMASDMHESEYAS
jgi:hypothetical protein